jgi:hypothetical protein
MRPIRAGQQEGKHGRKQGDVYRLEYGEGGFGIPAGVPLRASTLRLLRAVWSDRIYFDRPSVIIPDTVFAGQIYWNFCGPSPAGEYCPFSGAANYVADNVRPGQPIFIHRPGEYNFYADVDVAIVSCRILDAAFVELSKPQLKHIVGWDPTTGSYRTIGCSATDPAALNVQDTAVAAAIAAISGAGGSHAGFGTDTASVAVPGTAQQLPAHAPAAASEFTVIARSTNTGLVWVGESAAQAQARLIPLNPTDAVKFRLTNTNLVWIDAAVGTEGIGVIWET